MASVVVVSATRRWTVTNRLVSAVARSTSTLLLLREAAAHGTGPVTEDRSVFIATNRVQHVLDGVVARHLLNLLRKIRSTVLALLELAQRAVELEELLGP